MTKRVALLPSIIIQPKNWTPCWKNCSSMKLLFNARIYTQDRDRPVVSAVLLDGGRILAYGEKSELLATGHKIEQELDLRGRVVLPGLTDAHLHLQHYALS